MTGDPELRSEKWLCGNHTAGVVSISPSPACRARTSRGPRTDQPNTGRLWASAERLHAQAPAG